MAPGGEYVEPAGLLTLHSDLSHPVSQVGLLAYSSSRQP